MTVITDYIAKLPEGEQIVLNRLRDIVYAIAPDSEDAFSYGIPTYRYKDTYLIAFASNKHFMSIYPGADAVGTFKADLVPFKQSKGTISFTPDNPLSDQLLHSIVQLCKDAIDQKR